MNLRKVKIVKRSIPEIGRGESVFVRRLWKNKLRIIIARQKWTNNLTLYEIPFMSSISPNDPKTIKPKIELKNKSLSKLIS